MELKLREVDNTKEMLMRVFVEDPTVRVPLWVSSPDLVNSAGN